MGGKPAQGNVAAGDIIGGVIHFGIHLAQTFGVQHRVRQQPGALRHLGAAAEQRAHIVKV